MSNTVLSVDSVLATWAACQSLFTSANYTQCNVSSWLSVCNAKTIALKSQISGLQTQSCSTEQLEVLVFTAWVLSLVINLHFLVNCCYNALLASCCNLVSSVFCQFFRISIERYLLYEVEKKQRIKRFKVQTNASTFDKGEGLKMNVPERAWNWPVNSTATSWDPL